VFTQYGPQARKVLEALLDKYADTGISNIEDIRVLTLDPLSQLGTPQEIVENFGGADGYKRALNDIKKELYA
jgi:type I restriction enzyme R subunit